MTDGVDVPNPTQEHTIGTTDTPLRIAKVLERHKVREGSYTKLEAAIRKTLRGDGEGTHRGVDRRKLKAIVDNDPKLVLSIAEIRAIDRYLERWGEGLAFNPLFEKPELLRRLVESGTFTFLLGSKVDKTDRFRINISHWDLLGLDRIQTDVLSFRENVRIEIREVRMHDDVDGARADLADPELVELFGLHGPSLVCLASSRGNQMAEWMLCHMANLEPFRDAAPGQRVDLPFHFVWSRPRPFVLPSQFHLYNEDVNLEDPKAGALVSEHQASCFRYSGGYLVDELTVDGRGGEGFTYSLCAAQRRERGQIWILVAGLTGPGTLAAARWANKMATTIYDAKPDKRSAVFWSLLRTRAVKGDGKLGADYQLSEPEVVSSGVGLRPE